jgi:hypothetical protein
MQSWKTLLGQAAMPIPGAVPSTDQWSAHRPMRPMNVAGSAQSLLHASVLTSRPTIITGFDPPANLTRSNSEDSEAWELEGRCATLSAVLKDW